jgi:hypothetical protein
MTNWLSEYFHLPPDWPSCLRSENLTGEAGFFRFGSEIICYGRCKTGAVAKMPQTSLYDASKDVSLDPYAVHLPFDPSEVIENLYRESYEPNLRPTREGILSKEVIRKPYYFARKLLPVSVRRHLQRAYFSGWQKLPFPAWPVDCTVDKLHHELLKLSMKAQGVQTVPFIWFWPQGAPNCLIMTHDVETSEGRDFTSGLMNLDESFGIRASFQVIPEKRYDVPEAYVQEIKKRGFEFNIHDLNHDGHLYREHTEFLRRAVRINKYVRRYQARGFRAGAMYRNPEWYTAFEFSYDMSVPNVAHLEPKRGGCCTVMPFFIGNILELPLTATQDYSLFHILNDYSINLWKKQLDLIRENHGLISFIAHPDYLIDRKNRAVYECLLDHLQKLVKTEDVWNPLPGELDVWWRARREMKLVQRQNGWEIEGPQAERARVAYAVLENGSLRFEVDRQ